jgi:hypothetical protein
METKFKVGQVWKTRDGELRKIEQTGSGDYSIYSASVCGSGGWLSHALDGGYFVEKVENGNDLIEMVMDADGMPTSPEAASAQIEPTVFDATRTEFIERMVHDMFFKALTNDRIVSTAIEDATTVIREAIKLRDELVRGENE